MRLILVTGMSGAGKTVALRTLEDIGFEAIDNLPLEFLPAILDAGSSHFLPLEGGGSRWGSGASSTTAVIEEDSDPLPASPFQGKETKLAIGVDIRSRDFSHARMMAVLGNLRALESIEVTLVYLDCDDEVLQRRYTETRRRHPLAADRPVMDGVKQEREIVGAVRDMADIAIDTSQMEAADLRRIINGHFAGGQRQLSVSLISFSFKRGIPREADMLFDVRFLQNPYYVPELKELTGLDERVGAYIANDPDYEAFLERATALLLPLMPRYAHEGKHYLTIAIGCTGGRHRSVYTAERLAERLRTAGYAPSVRHRDVG